MVSMIWRNPASQRRQSLDQRTRLALMWWADDLGTIRGLPLGVQQIPREAEVFDIDALRWSADTGQTRRGLLSSGKKGLSQPMIVATACGKAKTGNHANRGNGGEQMKALIPANAVAPANIGLSCQPACAPSFRIARGNARTVQR